MKIILQGFGDLIGQAYSARFALTQRPNAKPGEICIVTRGAEDYAVRWNKRSITVYPQTAQEPTHDDH